MTRESKLALILGFAAVLLVGLLVSDHLSKARRQTPGADIATAPDAGAAWSEPSPGMLPKGEPLAADHNLTPTEFGTRGNAGGTGPGTAGTEPDPHIIKMDEAAKGSKHRGPRGPLPDAPVTASQTDQANANNGANNNANSGSSDGSASAPSTPGPDAAKPVSTGVERRHPVVSGDTFAKLADRYYSDRALAKALADYNSKIAPNPNNMRVGVTLRIPPKDVLLGRAVLAPGANSAELASSPAGSNTNPSPAPTPTPAPAPAPAPTNSGPRTVTVKPGDTLSKIARAELGDEKRWRDILRLNRDILDEDANLSPGMTLKLPAAPAATASTTATRTNR